MWNPRKKTSSIAVTSRLILYIAWTMWTRLIDSLAASVVFVINKIVSTKWCIGHMHAINVHAQLTVS